jgi:pyrroline-5-carboxylate reductase
LCENPVKEVGQMELGMIGLGRMGANMSERLLEAISIR